MNREQKAAAVEEVATQIQESEAVFAVDYRGISVPQAAELRVKLNEAGARFRVVKNTLTQLSADKAGAESLKELLEGPTAFTFVTADGGDVALAAKALAQFRRETELLEFKGGVMGGEAISAEQITALSRLPALDVLHGQLVGVIASPITGLVRGLNALIAGLAIQLQQIAEQGLVGGEAPAAEGEAPAAEADAAPEAEAEPPAEDQPAEAEQAAQDEQAEEEAAQSAEGEETESSSEGETPAEEAEAAPAEEAEAAPAEEAEAAPAEEAAADAAETEETDAPSEGDADEDEEKEG
jgi:large subunit ribosomal protein L10